MIAKTKNLNSIVQTYICKKCGKPWRIIKDCYRKDIVVFMTRMPGHCHCGQKFEPVDSAAVRKQQLVRMIEKEDKIFHSEKGGQDENIS